MTTYIAGDNMITSLGFSTWENMQQFKAGVTGIKRHKPDECIGIDCHLSLADSERLDQLFSDVAKMGDYTRLEKLAITSVRFSVEPTDIDLSSPNTLFILSTTKGNIDLLGNRQSPFPVDRMQLWRTAQIISTFFENPNTPLVVSNACISGVLAILTGHRLLMQNRFKHMVVVGVDIASEFVVSGFQSFKALSATPCKPFDKNRKGLSLGEGASTVLLTSDPAMAQGDRIVIRGGASASDANHITGPSRTGEGLHLAIEQMLRSAHQPREQIDYISAHGTATLYNDDMESNALYRSGLDKVPVNSLKGYFGHTLGAAGILETVAAIRSMRENTLIATKGFQVKGTDKAINIIKRSQPLTINHCLKMASGFGGCNAGILLSKDGTF